MKTLIISPKNYIQNVFDSLSPNTEVIFSEGTYRQKAVLSVPNVTLTAKGNVKIVYDDFAKKSDNGGKELTTFKSFTLAITADNVTMRGITVENDKRDPKQFGQEVALYVNGNGFVAEHCVFTSTQDTLFCGPLPDDLVVRYDGFLPDILRYREGSVYQRYSDCKISGTVDFIFGCANALFENCEIVSLDDGRDIGYVAAPSHSLADNIGFVFDNCKLVGNTAATVYLARAWRDFGKATFIDCAYDKHIAEEGFINWQGTERQRTARFAEFCRTPHSRVQWSKTLSESEAKDFLRTAGTLFGF